MNREVELKLGLPAGQAARLARLPELKRWASGPARRRMLVSTYFDTPDCALMAREMALRVRKVGRTRVQTLKGGGNGAASLQDRFEIEHRLKGDSPDVALLPDEALGGLDREVLATSLRPLFTTAIRRTEWPLRYGESEIALALDQGIVRAGDGAAAEDPIGEIELELKSGRPDDLFALAHELAALLPLTLEHRSKAMRGYMLAFGRQPEAVKAAEVALEPRMSAGQALKRVVAGCLQHLRANEACALAGEEPEGVHQVRVALRQIRSALGLWGEVVAPELLIPWKEGLSELANGLGPARDWDVFLKETLPPVLAALPEAPGLADLAATAESLRAESYAAARTALRAPATTRLVLALEAWVALDEVGPESKAAATPVMDFAARVLKRRRRKLRAWGRKIGTLDAAGLHRLRIAAKKMRYAAEFFAGLYPAHEGRRQILALKCLQDDLGLLNDAAVAARLVGEAETRLEAAGGGTPLEAARAAGIVLGWHAARIEDGRRRLKALWADFDGLRPFWKR